jgi:hypothetical protein
MDSGGLKKTRQTAGLASTERYRGLRNNDGRRGEDDGAQSDLSILNVQRGRIHIVEQSARLVIRCYIEH